MFLHKARPVEHKPSNGRMDLNPNSHVRSAKTDARTVGVLAAGALAIGALAIGAFAIGRLVIGRARIRRLDIDKLVVGRLHVTDSVEMSSTKSDKSP